MLTMLLIISCYSLPVFALPVIGRLREKEDNLMVWGDEPKPQYDIGSAVYDLLFSNYFFLFH
jgi:hypothetical protein